MNDSYELLAWQKVHQRTGLCLWIWTKIYLPTDPETKRHMKAFGYQSEQTHWPSQTSSQWAGSGVSDRNIGQHQLTYYKLDGFASVSLCT